MALDYKIWQGIGALNTYCGVTSAWRWSVLSYIALRSKHDYFFASLEDLAKDVGCSHDTAASVMNDLIEVGAVELVAYADLPGWIRKLHPRYNPNKKYWHVTGEYTIADVTYQYKWNGDAGADVVSEKIVANKTIQNKRNKKTLSAPNGTGDETAISLSEQPTTNDKQPIHTKTQRKSEQWLAISQAVDSTIYEGLTRDALHGWICDYLYMWHEATPNQVENFVKWYTASHGEMVKQITRIKGTPCFEGKFCFWFEKWLKETRAKVVKLAPVPMDTPQYMQGVVYHE